MYYFYSYNNYVYQVPDFLSTFLFDKMYLFKNIVQFLNSAVLAKIVNKVLDCSRKYAFVN